MSALFGTFLSVGSPALAELASECGYDWVLMDLEHGCETEHRLQDQLRALKGSSTLGVVRIGEPQPDLIGRVLDGGAAGIMAPHVSSAEEAQHLVQCMTYPPQGRRGVSRTVRAFGYGTRLPKSLADLPKPLLFTQIESFSAVQEAEAIAAVPGVDVLFVGPADLSYDLQARHAPWTYEQCLEHVRCAARNQGKACGILARHSDDTAALLAQGFQWMALDSDLSLVREGFRKNLAAAKALAQASY